MFYLGAVWRFQQDEDDVSNVLYPFYILFLLDRIIIFLRKKDICLRWLYVLPSDISVNDNVFRRYTLYIYTV